MSTRNHAHTRGRSHQWYAGLTAWTVERARRPSNIWCRSFSALSCIRDDRFSFFAMVSSTSYVFMACLRHQSKSQGLACVMVEACARDLSADHALHHVRENVCALMGCSRRRFGRPACSAHPALPRSHSVPSPTPARLAMGEWPQILPVGCHGGAEHAT